MTKKRLLLIVFVSACLLVGSQGKIPAEDSRQYKKILLKFRSFTISPGEKIVGTLVTVSNGEIVYVYVPGGWSWQYSGMPITKHIVHCFSPNPSYGVTMTGRLPEISIYDMSGIRGKPLSIEALVEMENGEGKTYIRRMKESELDIQ